MSEPELIVSIHAPRTGRDLPRQTAEPSRQQFQSTRPARGATLTRLVRDNSPPCFNPRAPHGARHYFQATYLPLHGFNPRAPHGARLDQLDDDELVDEFQSTRPARGATSAPLPNDGLYQRFQSTRPARGATSEESGTPVLPLFQSTRPARGATGIERNRCYPPH